MSRNYDSDEEAESFGLSQRDIEDALDQGTNYGRKRRFRKEDAIYGMWAEHDSDEDEASRRRNKADYSRPVDFISVGVRGKVSPEDEDGSDSETETARFDETLMEVEENMEEEQKEHLAGLPKNFVSSSMKKGRTLGMFGETSKAKQKRDVDASSAARYHGSADKQFGSWEKHTKGFGMKMLQKFGYQPGQGLGRDGAGIIRPIDVKLRGGRGAVGAYGSERTKQSQQDFPTVDSEEEEEKKHQAELDQWRKAPEGGKEGKIRYKYRSANEVRVSGVKAAGQKAPVSRKPAAQVKVLDLRGPEQRVYSGYDLIQSQHAHPDAGPQQAAEAEITFLPELYHNVVLLVDLAETDLLQGDRQLRHEQDRLVSLQHERDELQKTADMEKKQLDRLQAVYDLTSQLAEHSQPGCSEPLTLEDCEETWKLLHEHYLNECMMYDLGKLAIPIVFPRISEKLALWDPLSSSTYGCDIFTRWRDLLSDRRHYRDETTMPSEKAMSIYDRLVWEHWMPKLRQATREWNVRASEPMIELLEAWLPLLPHWLVSHIFDQWVFPKLEEEVKEWNPTTDAQPINTWLHPWLPLMSHRMEPLYQPIRYRLSVALTNWHPRDQSARAILLPWVNVFSQGSMDHLLTRSILPKLAECLQNELVINPSDQKLEPFQWVMAWQDLMPRQAFVEMLDKQFFRKWTTVLHQWLQPVNSPNFEEVIHWYSEWKGLFGSLVDHPLIEARFKSAVEVMHHMVSQPGVPVPAGAYENVAYVANRERIEQSRKAEREAAVLERSRMLAAAAPVSVNFRDVVQRRAEENGVQFVPDRMYNGHMLYHFGRAIIYLESNVVFVQTQPGSFVPVALEELTAYA